MQFVKTITLRGRVRFPFNQPARFGAGPDAVDPTNSAPLTVQPLRQSNSAYYIELETLTQAQVIRSALGARHHDCGYDEEAWTADRGLHVPWSFHGGLLTLPAYYAF